MMQRLTKHVICTHKQSRSCTVESPQSRDSPTMMLYYVHQTLFFPAPTQKKEKGLAMRDYASSLLKVTTLLGKLILSMLSELWLIISNCIRL